ncbi:MAG: hypothetical protein ACRDSZ_09750, partial [Pseudonocardiaceae bacterium]
SSRWTARRMWTARSTRSARSPAFPLPDQVGELVVGDGQVPAVGGVARLQLGQLLGHAERSEAGVDVVGVGDAEVVACW